MKSLLLVIITMLALAGCKKDFLEINPKGRLIAKTTSDYDLLLFNSNTFNLLAGVASPVSMGDEIAAVNPYFQGSYLWMQNAFKWEDDIYQPDKDADELNNNLRNLYVYSKIINEVMESKGGTEEQKLVVQAEAQAGRAWTNLLLFNYYGKPYTEASANTDLGFPLILKADVTENTFTRATVKEGYDQIISDLTQAIAYLPVEITHRLRWSKPAAESTLGKAYMYMRKWEEALQMFDAAIGHLSSAKIPVRLYNYNESLDPVTSFIFITNHEENMIGRQVFNYATYNENEFAIPQHTIDLYGASDLRLNFYTPDTDPSGEPLPAELLRRKSPLLVNIGFLVSDLYLLRAECRARLNDLEGGKADVEILRKNRMPEADAAVPANIAGDRKELIKFILDERIREFAVMGYRWFDMRRLSVDPEFSQTVRNTHILYDAEGNVEQTFTLRPERLTMRIPLKVIDRNPGMPNNE